jgi:cyclic beta-1,2-glucan synthetase
LALGTADTKQLRRVARRTWHYFERYVTAADHHLPPDNVQQDPDLRVAHRTSPTNIGMGLLSTLAAHDLGYLDRARLASRLEDMLTGVEALERHEGHLLNWYDTTTLASLAPRYVSTVDSGNLAGSLMALAAGLRERAVATEDVDARVAGALDTAGRAQRDARGAVAPRARGQQLAQGVCRRPARARCGARSSRRGRTLHGTSSRARTSTRSRWLPRSTA